MQALGMTSVSFDVFSLAPVFIKILHAEVTRWKPCSGSRGPLAQVMISASAKVAAVQVFMVCQGHVAGKCFPGQQSQPGVNLFHRDMSLEKN
ncbi:hypothetical protein Tco_0030732, partial [Tanacetum coccineum]